MADCSYSRCLQQRRNIKRELQKWTKNMVYIVGKFKNQKKKKIVFPPSFPRTMPSAPPSRHYRPITTTNYWFESELFRRMLRCNLLQCRTPWIFLIFHFNFRPICLFFTGLKSIECARATLAKFRIAPPLVTLHSGPPPFRHLLMIFKDAVLFWNAS